ncbi:MAG: DUF6569 family protein [Gaiellales bacterium]
MTTMSAIDETIQLGEPLVHRGISVYPLFPRRAPAARYVTLDEALPLGLRVTELNADGTVPELLVHNPLETPVLLYDGEELVGAKQNRILDLTVLVPSRSELPIPVACVEQGRWSRRSDAFSIAPHAAYPELRRRKAEVFASAGPARGGAQGVVWDAVAEKLARHQARSATRAQADLFATRERDLAGLRGSFPLQGGQCGAILALPGGKTGPERAASLSLDCLSRPDAFARLYPRLLQGYLLDALERLDGTPVDAEAFLVAVGEAPARLGPSPGLGEDVRISGEDIVGSGLVLDGELVQLSAFTGGTSRSTGPRSSRPSRRR